MAILIFGHTEGVGTVGVYVLTATGGLRKYNQDFIGTGSVEWTSSTFAAGQGRAVFIDSNNDAIVNAGPGSEGASAGTVYRVASLDGAITTVGDSYDSVDSYAHGRFVSDGTYYYTGNRRITIASGTEDFTFSAVPSNQDRIKAIDLNDGSVFFAGENAFDPIRKYNSSGTLQWTYNPGPNDWGSTRQMQVDSSGKVYAVGADFSPYQAKAVRIDSDGNNPLSINLSGFADTLDIDDSGNFYVGHGSGHVKKYNSAGTEQWSVDTGSENVQSLKVSISKSRVYVLTPSTLYFLDLDGNSVGTSVSVTNAQDIAVPA